MTSARGCSRESCGWSRATNYSALSGPQIADKANVSVDTFCELFADKQDCFLAALDMIGDEALAIAADPDLVSSDWPRAVCRVLAELMRYLAEHPLQARTLAQEAFFAGNEALERTVDLSHSIATLLTEGAPAQAQGTHTVDAVAGAIWHTIRCQVAGGRVELLPPSPTTSPTWCSPRTSAPRPPSRSSPTSTGARLDQLRRRRDRRLAKYLIDQPRRRRDRRSAKYVSTIPTSSEITITTISGALPDPNAQWTSTSFKFSNANTIASAARMNSEPARASSPLARRSRSGLR